jgi:hypothetical protein
LGDFGLLKLLGTPSDDDREVLKESAGPGMPMRYRTPDQVDYLHGRSELTVQSDVFQLGLVLAELFTGANPEKPGVIDGPVEMSPLRSIPGGFFRPIANIIGSMLEIQRFRRPSVRSLQVAFEGVFQDVVKQAHLLEGRAIW